MVRTVVTVVVVVVVAVVVVVVNIAVMAMIITVARRAYLRHMLHRSTNTYVLWLYASTIRKHIIVDSSLTPRLFSANCYA